MDRVERPLSPHLQIYRWRITMWLSALHRISGLLLSLAAFVFGGWLIALAGGADSYQAAQGVFGAAWFKVLAAVWALSFFYHLSNGVRHLAWDTGYGFERGQVRATGWVVVALTLVSTAAFILIVIV